MSKNVLIDKFQAIVNPCVNISGSKSYANRALIVSAIANGVSKISNLPYCDDVKYMLLSLENLGIVIEKIGENEIKIYGNSGVFSNIKKNELFCNIAGTTSRFLTSLAILIHENIIITGCGKLLERPISDLENAISQLGVEIKYLEKNGCIPIEILSQKNLKNTITLNGNISSQFTSSLLMIAPRLKNGLKIQVQGEVISRPYIDITLDVMQNFGVQISHKSYAEYQIYNQRYIPFDCSIEGDWSSASYFFAFSLANNIDLKLYGLKQNSIQGDCKITDIFIKMGCKIEHYFDYILIKGSKKINPIEVNMNNMPDSAMTIICMCALADGVSVISGLSTLKNKETDRLLAIHTELLKLGIKTEIYDEKIVIYGNSNLKLENIVNIETYHDHRVAMCFAIMASRLGNIVIEDYMVVSKSMPEFWYILKNIGVIFQKC